MVWDREPPMRSLFLPKDLVAPRVVIPLGSQRSEGFDGDPTRDDGQPAHVLTSTVSSEIGGGIGSLCFFRPFKYPWIASTMFRFASSRVFPWETHPGSAGHWATKTPSSPCSNTNRNLTAPFYAPLGDKSRFLARRRRG